MKFQFSLLPCALIPLLTISTVALGGGKVKLPPSAKMLTKAEVMAVYGGKSAEWTHPNTDKVTGTVTWDATVSTATGTWKDGKNSGKWEGKITFKGDQYCYETHGSAGNDPFPKKYNKMVCNLVYQDTDGMTYEVDPKSKKVLSTDKIVN